MNKESQEQELNLEVKQEIWRRGFFLKITMGTEYLGTPNNMKKKLSVFSNGVLVLIV